MVSIRSFIRDMTTRPTTVRDAIKHPKSGGIINITSIARHLDSKMTYNYLNSSMDVNKFDTSFEFDVQATTTFIKVVSTIDISIDSEVLISS